MSNLIEKAKIASRTAAKAERGGNLKHAHGLWQVALSRWQRVGRQSEVDWCKVRIGVCAFVIGDDMERE